jgi:ribonuclease BN (tRNA processing enzyme)
MKIILLGSGGYFPNRRRQTACLMIPEAGVVLDAGTAAFEIDGLVATDGLDVFLSHAHLDHVFGLTCLLGLYDGQGDRRIRVHAERPKIQAIREHLFSELLFPVAPPCTFVELSGDVALPGEGNLAWFPLERHPGGSVGFRLEWPGHSLAYVTDTVAAVDADYVEHIRGVDLLIHEAYFNDDQRAMAELTGHSCVTDVARVARAAQVKRLVMVHMNPLCDEDQPLDLTAARQLFPSLEIGKDGMEVEF